MKDVVILELIRRMPFASPVLDVGAGDSLRRQLLTEMMKSQDDSIFGSEVDIDNRHYEFTAGYFGTIISTQVIEHLFNPLFHLREVRRVLKPDGILYLCTPDDYSWMNRLQHLLGVKYGGHFHQYSENDLRGLLDKAGFSILEVKRLRQTVKGVIEAHDFGGLFVCAQKC